MTMLAPILAQDPDVIAFADSNGSVTYGQFGEDIDTMAHWLRDQGVKTGSLLGIRTRSGHSYWTWVAHLAAIRIGAHHATINSADTIKAAIACGVDCCVVINGTALDSEKKLRVLAIAPAGLAPLASQLGVAPRAWEEPDSEAQAARLVFTSGTTGKPKAVVWSAQIMTDRVETAAQGADLSGATRLLAVIGLMTTAGFRYPIAVWRAGGTVFGWRRQSGSSAAAREAVQKCSLLVTSPVNLQALLSVIRGPWRSCEKRSIILLGGRVPGALRDAALRRACAHVAVGYGSTETGRVATGNAALVDRHPGAVGYVVDDATVEIVDQQDEALPRGTTGIVRLRTSSMCAGYEGAATGPVPDGDAGSNSGFRDGWFYPGDHGILFDDGLLAIAGRVTDTVNLGGVKVSLPGVEDRVAQIPGIEDLCIVPLSLDRVDVLALVTVLADGTDPEQVRRKARHALPTGCPFRLIVIDRLPRNAMGKIGRDVIARRLSSLVQSRETKARARRSRRSVAPAATHG